MANQTGQTPEPGQQRGEKEGEGQLLRKLGLLGIIVGDLVGFTGAGIGLGYLAWTKLQAPWWVILITTSVGLGLAFYQLYRLSQKEL